MKDVKNAGPAWYCVRSQPKHEHIAAARLRTEGFEVFLPRLRFKRNSVRGPVWVTEALFPNYLFARFDLHASLRLVRHAAGVSQVVHFGEQIPAVPDQVMAELRAQVGAEELHVVPADFAPEDRVQISGGALHGLSAVVTQVMPAKERVKVLLDFLGRQTTVELGAGRAGQRGRAAEPTARLAPASEPELEQAHLQGQRLLHVRIQLPLQALDDA